MLTTAHMTVSRSTMPKTGNAAADAFLDKHLGPEFDRQFDRLVVDTYNRLGIDAALSPDQRNRVIAGLGKMLLPLLVATVATANEEYEAAHFFIMAEWTLEGFRRDELDADVIAGKYANETIEHDALPRHFHFYGTSGTPMIYVFKSEPGELANWILYIDGKDRICRLRKARSADRTAIIAAAIQAAKEDIHRGNGPVQDGPTYLDPSSN
jgi:hypothetical protein